MKSIHWPVVYLILIWANTIGEVSSFFKDLVNFPCEYVAPLNESTFNIDGTVSRNSDGMTWKVDYRITWPAVEETAIYFVTLAFEEEDVPLERLIFGNCSEALRIGSTATGEDHYRSLPEYDGSAPFTHKAVFKIAYLFTSGVPVRVSPAVNIFFETPDCYAETENAEFCATQNVVRCGAPRDVSVIGTTVADDTISVTFEWMVPVQINSMYIMQSYTVQFFSGEGELVAADTVTADRDIVTWVGIGNMSDWVNSVNLLTVEPFVRKRYGEYSEPVAGRMVKYLFTVDETPMTSPPTVSLSDASPSPLHGHRPKSFPVVVVIVLAIFLFLLLAVVIISCRLCGLWKKLRGRSGLSRNVHLSEMYSKNIEGSEQKKPVDEMLKDKEVLHGQVLIEDKIGEGEFGVVHRGLLKMFKDGRDKDVVVAVKTTKAGASVEEKEDLLNEMKLIAELGDHPNILYLVACCSTSEPFYLITEFMRYGDLLLFLRKCRKAGEEVMESIYHVSEVEQLMIARDIAKGMAHIQEGRFYHGDLAARNILIGDKLSVKISDFGLADDIYTRGYKRREVEQKIPIKWCSIETILNGICSPQGDVWSFGVLLYEVFTLGGTPYPGISPKFLVTQLRQGYRMERPDGCPEDVYDLMGRCWQDDPDARPIFTIIAEDLADMLMKRTDYVEFDMVDGDDPRYVPSPVVAVNTAKLALINDEDNEVDIEQLHSALKSEELLEQDAEAPV